MTRRSAILLLAVCLSLTVFASKTPSRTADAERGLRSKIEREKRRKEWLKGVAERKKEFLLEKSALAATEEQWKVIKPKLEEVRRLRDQSCSSAGLFLTSSSGSGAKTEKGINRNKPGFQWRISWKDKPPAGLTEAQKIANELIALVDKKNVKAGEFKKKMDALRESRKKQEQLKKQLSDARKELREVLTTRQEAALVLMGWLGCRDDFD